MVFNATFNNWNIVESGVKYNSPLPVMCLSTWSKNDFLGNTGPIIYCGILTALWYITVSLNWRKLAHDVHFIEDELVLGIFFVRVIEYMLFRSNKFIRICRCVIW